jgi:hypothetical protein
MPPLPLGQPPTAELPGLSSRWYSSSRRHPCPLCGRNTDDKCRWNDNVILCHQGDRFGPPSGLKLGDVLSIEGRRWAVCSFSGGFSGAAMVLRPHVDRLGYTPAQRQRRAREQAVLRPVLYRLFAQCREQAQACLDMPELEFSTAKEIQAELDHAKGTFNNLVALRIQFQKARREAPELSRYVATVDQWLRQVGYQLKDVESFTRVHLGTPRAEQIASLSRAR